ncbi:MAG: protein-tyrosine phosphatase [Sphingobacteriales bacterium]|jgi:protein-tyrosine phosphatase
MKVLFVCLGNICRSPMAEGILTDLVAKSGLKWEVDSAGTGDWHVGEQPDPRALATAKKFGVDISKQKARQFTPEDFDNFDRIYVMDTNNYRDLLKQTRGQADMVKVDWVLNLSHPGQNKGVTDPYFAEDQFETVFNELKESCKVLIQVQG